MTAQPTGHLRWSPDMFMQRQTCHPADSDLELVLSASFEIRLPIADIAP